MDRMKKENEEIQAEKQKIKEWQAAKEIEEKNFRKKQEELGQAQKKAADVLCERTDLDARAALIKAKEECLAQAEQALQMEKETINAQKRQYEKQISEDVKRHEEVLNNTEAQDRKSVV